MTTPVHMPTRKTIILVGLVGCLLTSMAGVTGTLLVSGWSESGGWFEWGRRLAVGYPWACVVVLSVFPVLVPRMTRYLESQRAIQEQQREAQTSEDAVCPTRRKGEA
jgi:hypothetical protein